MKSGLLMLHRSTRHQIESFELSLLHLTSQQWCVVMRSEAMTTTSTAALTPVLGSPVFQHPFHTPSPALRPPFLTPSSIPSISGPISCNVSHRGLNTKLFFHRYTNIALRSLAFLFAFISAITLAAGSSRGGGKGPKEFNLLHLPEFRYCISAETVASIYSAIQLFTSIRDMGFKGFVVSDKASDYITFFLDQMVTYLLLSSSSVSVLATERLSGTSKSSSVVSVCMSFAAFAVIAVSTLMSGYKLCKRIVW